MWQQSSFMKTVALSWMMFSISKTNRVILNLGYLKPFHHDAMVLIGSEMEDNELNVIP